MSDIDTTTTTPSTPEPTRSPAKTDANGVQS